MKFKQEKFLSVSSSSFMRNTLDEDREELYEQVLYPRQSAKNKTLIQRSSYPELISYLTDLSSRLNTMFSALTLLRRHGPGDQAKELIQALVKNRGNEDQQIAAMKKMTLLLNSGRSHIIRPSSQFKNGFDFIFSGLPESCLCLKPQGTATYDSTYTDTVNEHTEKVREETENVYSKLFGKQLKVSDAHKRVLHRLNLDTNFSTLDTFLNSIGINLFDDLKLPKTVSSLQNYIKILVIKEPAKNVVSARLSAKNRESFDNASVIKDVDDYLLNPNIYLSFVLSLPQDWAEHISQVSGNEKVHLNSLNTWVSVWSSVAFSVRGKKGDSENAVRESGGKLNFKFCPRFVLSASHLTQLPEIREKLGFYIEQGRTNDDGLYVSANGTLNWCPKSSEVDNSAAIDYENKLDAALELSYTAGSPLVMSMQGVTNSVFELGNEEYKNKIRSLKGELDQYKGQMLTYNWDYNTIITAGSYSPEKLVTISLAGATTPDALTIDDLLSSTGENAFNEITPSYYDAETLTVVPPPLNLVCRFYSVLEKRKVVPTFDALVKSAAASMKIKSLEDEAVAPYDLDLYSYINSDLTAKQISSEEETGRLEKTLTEVMKDATGNAGSKLARAAIKADIEVDEDPHFYSHEISFHNFKNIYNYLGGKVFHLAIQEIAKLKPKNLKATGEVSLFSASDLNDTIMPLCIVLSKYCTNFEKIKEEAEAERKKLLPDPDLDIEDLTFSGLNKNVQVFPHQFDGHRVLNNHPKFAFLDVAPGGGKTASVLMDIMNLAGKGLIKKPIIFAPNRLVKNWADDLAKFTNKWNVVPINLQQFRLWGEERLTKLISKAPRNTIVVCGYRFLNGDKYSITIGSTSIQVSGTMEFLKKFKFDYIACDESHRTKNMKSFTHRGVKQLSTCSTVKYIRLATGSIIQNKLTDVVGQAALFSSAMFKTADKFEKENLVVDIDPDTGKKVTSWRPDAAERARKVLAKNVGVITAKRRDWAFMLPTPDETFLPVTLDGEKDNTHTLMYQAVLQATLEEIKVTRPDIMRMINSSGTVDDEDDDGDQGEEGTSKGKDKKLADVFSEDEDRSEELQAMLEPYIARLEQCLTDPLGDPFGEVYFEGINKEGFVSNKVKKIISRIKEHNTVEDWKKGKSYLEWEFVSYKGKTYQLSKRDIEEAKEEYTSIKEPSADKRWVERDKGKILIFCRYTRSVGAIYDALPKEYKKVAVKFTAKEKGGSSNLAKFKNSEDTTILIANEQALSEGHNLQMAGRLIRVETPWSPGELDQSISRIFRPSVGGKDREMIYLDWLIVNGTLEVPKMGRIIAKMLTKLQFDEYGNKNYDLLQKMSLPMISMDLKTIASTQNITDIKDDYIASYQMMANIQGFEFRQRKKEGNTKMLDVKAAPIFEGSGIVENVPYVPDQNIIDREGLDLTKASVYIDENKVTNPDDLKGLNAHTEFGNGTIVKVTQSKSESTMNLRQIWVQLAQTGEIYKADPSVVSIAEKLTEADLKKLKKLSPWADAKSKRMAEKLEARAEKLRLRQEKAAAKELEKAAKRQAKLDKKAAKEKAIDEEEQEKSVDMSCALYPVSYNGYLGLKASSDETTLEKYGFRPFKDFAFLDVTKLNPKQYDKLLDWLDDTFEVPNSLGKRLLALGESFNTRTKKFDLDLAPIADFKNFYRISHVKGGKDEETGKWILKVYPMVSKTSIILKVDITTNLFIRRYIGKKIPGLNVKWDRDDGMEFWVSKVNTRNDVVLKVKKLRAAGFNVENFEDVKEILNSMKTRKAK